MADVIARACGDFPHAARLIQDEHRHNPSDTELVWRDYYDHDLFYPAFGSPFRVPKKLTKPVRSP